MSRAVSKVQMQDKAPKSPAKPALRRSNAFLHDMTPPKTPMKAASGKMSTGVAETPVKSKKGIESSPGSQRGGAQCPYKKGNATVNKAKNFANSTTGTAKGPKVMKSIVKKKPAKRSMKAFKRPAAASSTAGRAKIIKATSVHFDDDICHVRMEWGDLKDMNESYGVAVPISWTKKLGRSNKLDKEGNSIFPLALISFELW